MTATDLYAPPDVDDAYTAWGANCGPCALAALLRVPVMEVRDYFPRFPAQPWTNPTHMKAALTAAGVGFQDTLREFNTRFPLKGLAFVQVDGPWCKPGVPVIAAYRHTHWVAMWGSLVYDGNAREWLTQAEWEQEIMPLILAAVKGSTGWWVRTGIEATP